MIEPNPHPRVEGRRAEGPPTSHKAAKALRGNSRFARLNSKIGLWITTIVGTMWAAYLFAFIALLSLPSALKSGDVVIIVAWVSSNFLQLVLLPIIIVGQNIQAKAADMRAQATYEDAEAVLHEAQRIQTHLEEQDKHLQAILGKFKGK